MSNLKRVALEVGAGVAFFICVLVALGDGASVIAVLPLLILVSYWLGKWRGSGQKSADFFRVSVEMPEKSNVVPLRSLSGVDRWHPCRPCKRTFNTEAELLNHQLLDDHGGESVAA